MSCNEITLKLSPEKLAELFRLGVLCASEINCVDTYGRDLVQQLCLQTCAHSQSCGQCHRNCHKNKLNDWPVTNTSICEMTYLGSKLTH